MKDWLKYQICNEGLNIVKKTKNKNKLLPKEIVLLYQFIPWQRFQPKDLNVFLYCLKFNSY